MLTLGVLLSLAACGETEAPTVPATTPATAAPTEPQPTAPPATEPSAYTAENMELVNDEHVTFTVTRFVENAHLGLEMHVCCENKTDKNLMFSVDGVSVCGVMHDPFWATEVAAGKKANSILYFDTFALAQQGIPSPDEITFNLSVSDSEDWMDAPFVDAPFTVYPTGLSAERVVYPAYEHKNGETIAFDSKDLLFIIEKVSDSGDGYTLSCYVENRTDRDLMVSWDDVSVNGFMLDPFWAAAVSAGKQLYTEISFYATDLAEQGIETVTEIEFELNAYDYDDFSADSIIEETIVFRPK